MKWAGCLAAALVLVLPSATARAQTEAGRMETYMRARADLGHFSGSVWVARGDEVLLDGGWGLTAPEGSRPDARTAYLAASLTKPVTAAAILLLRDQGRLALSDSICRFVVPCPDAWRPVTLEHLLRHTSGVPDYEAALELGSPAWSARMADPDSARAIIDEAAGRPLDFAPGSDVAYSNTGYVLLARVVSEASGRTYEAYVREWVFGPAGMTGARFGAEPGPAPAAGMTGVGEPSSAELARGRPPASDWLTAVDAPIPGAGHGDAALIATAADLGAFARWFLKTFPADLDLIREDEIGAGQGLGWGLTPGGGLAHNGVLPGYVSRITVDPATGLIVVVLANLDSARFDAVARDLAAIAEDQPYEAPRGHAVVALDAAWAEGLTGDYRLGALETQVVLEDGALFLVSPGRFRAGLLPEGPDAWYTPFFEGMVTFSRDAAGRATGFTLAFRGETHAATRAE